MVGKHSGKEVLPPFLQGKIEAKKDLQCYLAKKGSYFLLRLCRDNKGTFNCFSLKNNIF